MPDRSFSVMMKPSLMSERDSRAAEMLRLISESSLHRNSRT